MLKTREINLGIRKQVFHKEWIQLLRMQTAKLSFEPKVSFYFLNYYCLSLLIDNKKNLHNVNLTMINGTLNFAPLN